MPRPWLPAPCSGDAFVTFTGADGKPRLTTYASPLGDGVVGTLSQAFTDDATTSTLSFFIHGGDAAVKLYRGSDVVRATRGRRTNAPETPVIWRLEELRGETVRLVVDDDLTGPWGFVGVSGFTLH